MTANETIDATESGRERPAGEARLSKAHPVEWPTVALAAAIYLAFGLLTWFHAALPWWLLLLCGGFVTCLHGSLQHEVVHGHPTRWRRLNEALVFPSLWLWMPYRTYRRSHLAHHFDPSLTHPLEDPESYYVTAERWARLSAPARALLWIQNTVAGRLLIGPLRALLKLLAAELPALLRGDGRRRNDWGLHALGVGLVLLWVVGLCGMDVWLYVATFAYPGLSLTLLRSFLEHQARPEVATRTVLVEAGPVMSLLFLNNNLHALHHAEPGVAWYRLPHRYRRRREELLRENRGYRYGGYAEIIARHLFRPKEPPVHPFVEATMVVTNDERRRARRSYRPA